MAFKFGCTHCGQRVAATEDMFGTPAECPNCGHVVKVPFPMTEMPAELARLAAQVRSLVFEYLPAETDDPNEQIRALEEFLHVYEGLPSLYEDMEDEGEITRVPSRAESHAIGNYLLKVMLTGDFNGTDEELKDLVLQIVPGIRVG